ncbi:MAG: hypothetical protein IPM35_27775 [Myxococcales bacterium]|nr:hypothetical protein [Myxococcales bacterium]
MLARLRRTVSRWPTGVNRQELQALSRELIKIPEGDRFDALAEPFIDATYGGFLAQQYAGSLLVAARPPCSRPVLEVLRTVLPKWNRSIEELPQYLRECFGQRILLTALDDLDREHSVDPALTQTMRFWLRGRPDAV